MVRPSLVSASGSVRVVGRIPDTGGTCWFCDAAIATAKAEYSGTADPARLRNAASLSAHPAKTCPALRRAILFAARTILRPAAPAADSRPSAFSMVEVADLPAVSDFTSTDPTVSFVDDEEELDSDF